MIELLIIADDFTGALDTGVHFSACGAPVRVLIDDKHLESEIYNKTDVLVVNADTRGATPEQAYEAVYRIVSRTVACGVPNIYKKTDSALRGNIGSELAAALDACGKERIHFIPAFPQMGRTTQKGIHYIDGVPVNESVFGKDPFEPVETASVPQIIARQSNHPVLSSENFEGKPGIVLHNSASDNEIEEIARFLQGIGEISLTAGCAGFATMLPNVLGLRGEPSLVPNLRKKVVIVCGSVNPITVRQMDYAERRGIPRVRLTPRQKLADGYYNTGQGKAALRKWLNIVQKNSCCIFDTNGSNGNAESNAYAERHGIDLKTLRTRIPQSLAAILQYILEQGEKVLAFITGGDTLAGFLRQIGCSEIMPVYELAPGTVLSLVEFNGAWLQIVSKSGGFGEEFLIHELVRLITKTDGEVQYG